MAEQFVYLNTLIYTIPVETNAEVTTILSPFNLSATVIARVQGCKPHICLDGDYSLLHLDSLISLGYDSTRLLRAYVTNELLQ